MSMTDTLTNNPELMDQLMRKIQEYDLFLYQNPTLAFRTIVLSWVKHVETKQEQV